MDTLEIVKAIKDRRFKFTENGIVINNKMYKFEIIGNDLVKIDNWTIRDNEIIEMYNKEKQRIIAEKEASLAAIKLKENSLKTFYTV